MLPCATEKRRSRPWMRWESSAFGLKRGTRRFAVRLLIIGLLLAGFYSLEWNRAREGVRFVVARALYGLGYMPRVVDTGDQYLLVVGRLAMSIDRECTAVEMMCILLPFLWRARWGWRKNCTILGLAAISIAGVNIVRITAAAMLAANQYSWGVAHQLPDALLCYPTAILLALLALRADSGGG